MPLYFLPSNYPSHTLLTLTLTAHTRIDVFLSEHAESRVDFLFLDARFSQFELGMNFLEFDLN